MRRLAPVLCIPVLALAVLACAATPAFAEKGYQPGVSFGGPCVVEAGEPCQGKFDEPVGVAVNDETSDVYVVDKGNKRVEELTEKGVFLAEFAPPGGFEDPEEIAIDNSGNPMTGQGDVYVTDTGHKVVDKFSATGAYEGQMTEAEICEYNRFGEEPICEVLPFGSLHGVTVDSAGDLWISQEVVDRGNHEPYSFVDEFSDSGEFLRTFRTTGGTIDNAMGVDSDENVYLDETYEDKVAVYTLADYTGTSMAQNGYGHQYVIGGGTAMAITPPSSSLLAGDPLVDAGSAISLYNPIIESNQQPLETFPGETVPKGYEGLSESDGLAVNASETVYASEHAADRIESFDYVSAPVVKTEPASGVSETGLTLNGSVNPEGEPIKECYFEYGTEAGKYTNSKGEPNRIACGSNEHNPGEGCGQNPSAKNEEVAVCAVLTGLEPAQVRSFRLVVEAGSGIVKQGAGLTVARPATTGEAVSEVGSSTATVSAQIDGGGLATCYWFEFGTNTSYGGETAKSCVGPGEAEKARVDLVGLQPNTVYHFRVQARNDLGAEAGEDRLFTTFPASSAELPDGRVYEAVSSVGTGDETNLYVPQGMTGKLGGSGRHGIVTSLPFQAARSGGVVAYVGDPPASGGNGDVGDGGGNQYLAERASGGGWTQVDVDPSGYDNEYEALSDDLSVGVVVSSEQLAEDAPVEAGTAKPYSDLYGRSLGWRATAAGSLEPSLGSFEPLIAATPPCPVTEFGGDLSNALAHEPLFGGGNAGTAAVPAFSHVVVEADVALPSTPATGTPRTCDADGKLEDDLYDSVEGRLHLVNVLPDGKPQPGATIGRQGISPNGARGPDTSNAVSADGSRIYWSAVEPVPAEGGFEERPKALYVRENDTYRGGKHSECGEFLACTVQVDLSALPGTQGEKEAKGGGGQFWTASSDGSRVFFTDEKPLTKEATAAPGAPDLYEYDLEAPEEERLSDLSVPAKDIVCPFPPGTCGHADVQGVVGTSEDGSYVYFVAAGVLSEGKNVEEKEPVEGQPNLYVRHGGVTRFVATLSEEDGDLSPGPQANYGDWQAAPGHRTAEVSAGGQGVVFMSRLALTGYDNELEFHGQKTSMTEVFVYDAAAQRLTCASCNPSGEPPVAPALPEFAEDLSEIWASFLPASDSLAGYQPRVISADGDRVFFDSIEPLVPQDETGFLGVYEWEPPGEGSCTSQTASTVTGGCTYLLSGGSSNDNSYLVDASSSGDDVFFVSRAQLVKADHGDDDVLYDARVGGVEPPPERQCAGTGCQGVPPAPPLFATPASATIAGVEAYEPSPPPAVVKPKPTKCKKNFTKNKQGKCVKRKSKKKSKAKKSAHTDRRASS